jgi:HEAT repeat protein
MTATSGATGSTFAKPRATSSRTSIMTCISLLLASVVVCGPSANPSELIDSPDAAQIAALQAHYLAAEEELESRDIGSLTPDQRARREQLLVVLRAYRERGEFGRNIDFEGERMPYFVDGGGRRCAVAELLHSSGEDALVAKVREKNNHAWVVDLADDAEFACWLERNGVSLNEAARIQAPSHNHGQGNLVGRMPPPTPYGGPGDGGATGAHPGSGVPSAAGASGATPGAGGPTSGSPASGGPWTPGRPTTGGPSDAYSSASTQEGEFGAWALWWEYNKLEYLQPHQLSLWSFPATGDHARPEFESQIAAIRKSFAPLLISALEHRDSNVRSAAAVALGRMGGADAVAPLERLLDDPDLGVRHHAILALGATCSSEAASLLVNIAEHGTASADSKERVSRSAPALAIVALGLLRRQCNDPGLDEVVARIARTRRGEDRNLIEEAAFMYATLAPSAELERFALEVAQEKNGDAAVHARAVECLRRSTDRDTLSKMQHVLSGKRLELRRSAALAMGGVANPLATPALMTAYELEPESLTKSFLLISIGKQGGAAAREFLLKTLDKGDPAQRRWCALALGIVAHRGEDPTIADAIRAAARLERAHEAQAAYWIAAGLAHDSLALADIRDGLARSKDPIQRMYAATSLALIGGETAAAILRERRAVEPAPIVQVAIAQALGYIGEHSDAAAVLDTIAHLREPRLQSLAAVAMAFHGSSEALRGLSELARIDTGSSVRRAAAIDGVGMLLGKAPPLELSQISRSSNFTLFGDFEDDLFQVTL